MSKTEIWEIFRKKQGGQVLKKYLPEINKEILISGRNRDDNLLIWKIIKLDGCLRNICLWIAVCV